MVKKRKRKKWFGSKGDSRFLIKVGRNFKRTGLIHNKKEVRKSVRDLVQKVLGIPDKDFIEELQIPIGFENDRKKRKYNRRQSDT